MKGIPLEVLHQHDEMGNCPTLLSAEDSERIERGDIRRAGAWCLCRACGKIYVNHPQVLGALWLRRLCNGDLVKL